MKQFQLIVPVIAKDFLLNRNNYALFFERLPIREIIFIGPDDVESLVKSLELENISYINENQIIPYRAVYEAIQERITLEGYEMSENSRPGWYYQQFLKMEYSRMCEDDYYLVWDSDTIPLHNIGFVDEYGRPYFDVKTEHNNAYFSTIQNLFPDMVKTWNYSFIAEHMVFSKKRMQELIEDIENTQYMGTHFYEKIFFAISIENLAIGFSEFETYGTWMMYKYPEEYAIRQWFSLRCAGMCFDADNFSQEEQEWLARDFHAATFEKYNQIVPELYQMFHNPEYKEKLSALDMYELLLENGIISGLSQV